MNAPDENSDAGQPVPDDGGAIDFDKIVSARRANARRNEAFWKSAPKDKNGWPLGFFNRTAGALANEKFHRPPQGELETREAF